jgi:hypothetical protein
MKYFRHYVAAGTGILIVGEFRYKVCLSELDFHIVRYLNRIELLNFMNTKLQDVVNHCRLKCLAASAMSVINAFVIECKLLVETKPVKSFIIIFSDISQVFKDQRKTQSKQVSCP